MSKARYSFGTIWWRYAELHLIWSFYQSHYHFIDSNHFYFFSEDYYYRGLVLECNECSGLVRIAFIDFGNTEEVEFSKLKILPDELKQRPRLILLVKLKNVKDNPEADERLAMKEYLEKNSEEHTDKVLEVHGDAEYIEKNDTVELLDMDSKESINERLNRLIK